MVLMCRCIYAAVIKQGSEAWSICCIQAEDGIRDAQESRGLVDVYKRQVLQHPKRLPRKVLPVHVRRVQDVPQFIAG
mgnify:CR=1 FL=1